MTVKLTGELQGVAEVSLYEVNKVPVKLGNARSKNQIYLHKILDGGVWLTEQHLCASFYIQREKRSL